MEQGLTDTTGQCWGCSPLSWDMLNRPCCFLSVSRSPLLLPHRAAPHGPAWLGLGQLFSMAGVCSSFCAELVP